MATLSMSSVLLLFGLIVPLAQSLDSRIVGGQEVDITDYPYQVSVRVLDQHRCGGSIIDAKTILTAAHCTDLVNLVAITIRYGNTDNSKGNVINVSRNLIYLPYNPITLKNDISVLKLDEPIIFGPTAKAVPLQSTEVPVGTDAWVSGWGVMSEGSTYSPHDLRAVNVEVINRTDCMNAYPGQIYDGMLCAQIPYHDSCQGDSGGPLIAKGKLIGIVSWGIGCARPEYPGVYTNVSHYLDWIQENMEIVEHY